MKRYINILTIILVSLSVNAQGWVVDEASKDDSGGVFSGILGFVLLIGVVWIIGYVSDKISEDKDIRKKNNARQKTVLSKPNKNVAQASPQPKNDDVLNKMLLYDGLIDQSEKQNIVHSIDDLAFINQEKENYALTEILQVERESASNNWGKPENKEYEDWYDGQAIYSLDGKKIIDFEDRTDGHIMKDKVEVICDGAFERMPNSWKGPFPSSLKVLGNCLYSYDCDYKYIIPKSVETITGNPFAKCCGQIECLSPHFVYDSNGILYDKDKKKVISVFWNYEIEGNHIFIDPHTIMIGRNAFQMIIIGDKSKLVIPPSVLFIGDSAFEGSNINVTLSNGITEIGNSAFFATYFKEFILPPSVTKVGIAAFAHCASLEHITISPNIEVLDFRTFEKCEKLNHVYLPNGMRIIKNSCFSGCESLNEVWFPNSLEKIEKDAFKDCPLMIAVISRKTIVEEGAFPSSCKILFRD